MWVVALKKCVCLTPQCSPNTFFSGAVDASRRKDRDLGSVRIPVADLGDKRTGAMVKMIQEQYHIYW